MTTMQILRALARAAALALLGACALSAQAACDPTMACCKGVDIGGNPGCAGAGNPIDVITGNKYQREVDLGALPGMLGLEVVRHYNSVYAHDSGRTARRDGLVGRGWKLGYEIELVSLANNHLQVIRADGKPVDFTRGILNPKHYVADNPADGEIVPQEVAGGQGHMWRWLDGHEYSFDAKGRLVQIAAPTGEFVSLQHDPANGQLLKVTDPQGRSLQLQYGKSGYVQAIDSPVGRFGYQYGSQGQLLKAIYPGQDPQHTERLYHYEDPRWPTLLTGITVQGAGSDGKPMRQRIGTYAYDSEGRGNLTVKGEPARLKTAANGKPLQPARLAEGTGIEQVVLYHGRGKTIAVNGLGQKTEFTWGEVNGENQLLEVRGAGCSHCAGPNERYGYDKFGRLTQTTRITERRQPIETTQLELDLYGRTRSISRVVYRNGKAQPPQLLASYGYDGSSPSPTRISRPSVIAGKEQVTRIAYNEAGQPTSITEEGFSPIDEQGHPSPNGTPIKRATTYAYSRINGRSVLTQIDGPVPNGPKNSPEDSDITRIEYDARADHVLAVIQPMNLATRLEFDKQGRVGHVTGPSGFTDGYRYDSQGAVVAVTRTLHGQPIEGVTYERNAIGDVIEVLEQTGTRQVPRTRQEFDSAGRLLWQADALGVLKQAVYDPEGHVLRSTVVGAGMRQEERYRYDAQGRLQQVQDSTGVTRELVRDDAGRLIATIDPLGRWTRYEREANALRVIQAANTAKPLALRYEVDHRGHLQAISAQASDGVRATRTVTHQRLMDDFGREVAVRSPDSGAEVRRFDAAGRLMQVLQADGSTVDLEYDLSGRLVRRTVTPNAARGPQAGGIPSLAARPQTVRYRYANGRIAGIEDPEQTERYAYDERGRVQTKTVILRLNDGGQVTSTTGYRYDERGQLAARTLPDGSELHYERNGQGQIVALHRQAAPWAPFGWGRSTLVKDLERDLVGPGRITYGNGVEGRWQRSPEGVLARAVYTVPTAAPSAVRTSLESLIPEARAQAPAPTAPASTASTAGVFSIAVDPRALWDSRLLFDAAGNIVVQGQFADSPVAKPAYTALAYDAQDQLAQALRSAAGTVTASTAAAANAWRYHHDSLGNRLLSQQARPADDMAHTVPARYAPDSDREAAQQLDAAGRPVRDATRRYEWDGLGRLIGLTQDGKTTVYRYNRLGLRVAKQGQTQQHYLYDEQRHRVAELDAQGQLTRQYVWLGDQLIAVLDGRPSELQGPVQGWVSQLARAAQALWSQATGNSTRVAYVQVNHLGAPVLVTDTQAKPIWHAEYAPFGQRIEDGGADVMQTAGGHVAQPGLQGIRLDLRLPGQWEDEESGLYYNDQRYYDPQAGRYISPDPLGLRGGLNAYAYVGNNPLGYGDPLGLVLFAFDGTGNSDPAPSGDSISNVRKFYLAYDEVANGGKYYITGIGTTSEDMPYKGSLASGDGFDQRLQLGFDFLNKLINGSNETSTLDIDVVGFSRGAAEARAWIGQLVAAMDNGAYTTAQGKKRCLNLRFEGLWDSVPHLGLLHGNEKKYDFGIPQEMKYVAHAVALNEHRGGLADFDGRSIFDAPQTSSVPGRTEIGFVGSHADVGGGYGTGDLSDVALMWMVKQAQDQGIKFDTSLIHKEGWNVVSNPILHDKSGNKIDPPGFPLQYGDRDFIYGNGTKVKQSQAVIGGNDTAWARSFVEYYNVWCGTSGAAAVGVVDMAKYGEWLKQQRVDITYTAPATAHACN